MICQPACNSVKLDPEAELQAANALERKAALTLEIAQSQQIEARQAIRNIKQSYHPYDLKTGKARDAKMVEESLREQFNKLEQIAKQAELSESSIKRIEKAKRVLAQMVATIIFSPKVHPKGGRSALLCAVFFNDSS